MAPTRWKVTKTGAFATAFCDDPDNDGHDAIFGLTRPLMAVVNVFRSAALKYGSERRVLLLHGPVGSSKSTIARLLKRGRERYSRKDEGALYSYGWKNEDGSIEWSPMNDDPLRLVPLADRERVCEHLNEGRDLDHPNWVEITGDLNPLCRFLFRQRMDKYGGDWTRVVQDVVVRHGYHHTGHWHSSISHNVTVYRPWPRTRPRELRGESKRTQGGGR